ncbi:Vitamin K epoxide reductase family protein [Leptospira interrogans serovar Manilae]|uniref:Vitamin K epoxide reductase family protein n=1 Tax=Leptospira interrogans serovar Manilae TaxID=214675 RepID=A0AAQ1P0G4_LEPIR|nr:thioredoxin domain-containing protein [Leptospira interrogans]AKP24588.1 protein-disulfide isomerase [Leptospira interrogans serovar Manilae]AKP28375.1 protein-disulfide isomerase [Leptospira interrogans serovar Manilae]EYU63140.1 protein-disulfide isomerase [Leptospira interrogans serovar Manilae]SOR62068.1 Vitamin K epoxide reductase family protein [Leptospira interrogans serovar Manilae]
MNQFSKNKISIILSVLGLIFSFLLIQKYYGDPSSVGETICNALSESGSCDKVSESAYSAIRNVPGLGDLPIALFGFLFYGFVGFLFVLSEIKKESAEANLRLAFYVLVLGLVADLGLFLLSVGVIKALCGLCAATYGVTIALLIVNFPTFKSLSDKSIGTVLNSLNGNFFNFIIVILSFFVLGLYGGKISTGGARLVSGAANGEKSISEQLKEFGTTPTVSIDLKDVPVVGDPNAPITIVKYADFNCGHCMHTSKILKSFLSEYNGIIKVAYKNFPLDGNCNRLVGRKSPEASSCVAASAALCANEQKKFYPVYTGLYDDNEAGVMHTAVTVTRLAEKNGLNMNQFRSCMSSTKIRDQINREVDEAEKLKINSTPTLFINNKPLPKSGTPNVDFLHQLIRQLIN